MIQNISLLGHSWITIGLVFVSPIDFYDYLKVFTHGKVSGGVRQNGEEERNMANKPYITGEYLRSSYECF